MNIGNKIWDPEQGGKPSIRVFREKNAYSKTLAPWLLGDLKEEDNEKTEKN